MFDKHLKASSTKIISYSLGFMFGIPVSTWMVETAAFSAFGRDLGERIESPLRIEGGTASNCEQGNSAGPAPKTVVLSAGQADHLDVAGSSLAPDE